MKFIYKTIIFFGLIFFSAQMLLHAQQNYYTQVTTDTLKINLDNHYLLSGVAIVPFSEIVKLNDSLLSRGSYKISYSKGYLTLSDSLPYSIFDTLTVSYKTYRLSLQKEYKRRTLELHYDELLKDTLLVAKSADEAITAESIFGKDIEKSGTLVRGFTVGTNKDFSLNSGLRLQLSGRLSDNIEVVAALTDENTPIQPEGNTERLDELDKVFIQLKHPNAVGTFGDYQLRNRYGEFGNIDRKLQGLRGEFNYEENSAYIAVAGSKGKFNTNKFNGSDGVQGPYRLSGINNEQDIIIIAGSEKVYIDGIEMKRGERNDYTIEYSNAEITFTPNRLITSASRITVDFEYTDRRYSRNFFGAGVKSKFWKDKIDLQFQYLREGDDQDSPIDITLSESDKNILRNAGDNRNKAVKSGVSLAEPDSNGVVKGIYQKIDTLINGNDYSYYIYNPGNPNSLYNVSFSYVGNGAGDYSRESLGNYKFVGIGQGSYMPIIYLPLPELKQMGNLVFNINPFEDVSLSLEYAGSLWDKNRFSSLDNSDNYGYARNILLNIKPRNVSIGNINFGKIGFSYHDRFVQRKFTSLDRFNSIEFNREYNIGDNVSNEDEQLREFNLNLMPLKNLSFNSSFGFMKRGDNFNSTRMNNFIKWSDDKNYNVEYNLDYVKTKDLSTLSNWLRQKGSGYYKLGYFKAGLNYLAEDKKDRIDIVDSVLNTSLKYFELTPFLQLIKFDGLDLTAKYSLRDDYAPLNGSIEKQSRAVTQSYDLQYTGLKEFSSTLNFTLRNKKYTELFKSRGQLNSETILIRSQSRFNFWKPVSGNLYYEVSTQRAAKLQKVFVRVEKGSGNYKYLGDLNNNGVADENEFEPTVYDGDYIQITVPTDELYPVIDLKANTRWKIKFADMVDKQTALGSVINPLSTETQWRIEENSRESDYKKIYLLDIASFQNADKTIRGSNYFQQDVFLFENQRDFSVRFRYTQRKSLNQYSDGIERAYNRERSLRIRFSPIREISNQTDLVNEIDNVSASVASNRKRMIDGNSVNTDFSYRPKNNIEVGLTLKVGRKTDNLYANPTLIDINSQTLRFTLSFAGRGRLRTEIERSELTANSTENYIPFEITGGNLIGKNYYLRLNFDYRLSSNLQAMVNYDGRAQGGGKVIHTMKAEVRAYF